MNIEEVRKYCLSLPHTTEDMPYGPDWVVFRIGGKIFLHIWLEAPEPVVAIKLPTELAEDLRGRYSAIRPAYHLNKTHWSDVLLEAEISETQLKEWISLSYELVRDKLPKKVKETLK